VQILLVADLHYTLRQLDWVASVAGDYDLLVVAGDLLDIASAVDPDAQIAMALEVPMEALLQGVHAIKRRARQEDDPLALLSTGQAMRLARAFSRISDGRIRVALVSLAEGIASKGQ